MSEQLVIILLIALTFLVVLAALAIDEESSQLDDPLETSPPVVHSSPTVDSEVAIRRDPAGIEMQPILDDEGDPLDDARRAADVPETPGR